MKKLLAALALVLAMAVPAFAGTGSRQVNVAMFKFADFVDEPVTVADVNAALAEYKTWFDAEAAGQETLVLPSVVYGWYTLPHTLAYYCTDPNHPEYIQNPTGTYPFAAGACSAAPFGTQMHTDMATIANQHFNVYADHSYSLFLIHHYAGADTGAPWTFVGVNPPNSGTSNFLNLSTLAHEGAHADPSRPHHAARLDCPGVTPYNLNDFPGSGCTTIRYGDSFDPLGAGIAHFSAWHRRMLGWVTGAITWADFNGEYTIYDAQDTNPDHSVELRVSLSTDDTYVYTVDFHPSQGVIVRLHTPADATELDHLLINHGVAMHNGDSFVDAVRGITLTVSFENSQRAKVVVTVPGGGSGGEHHHKP